MAAIHFDSQSDEKTGKVVGRGGRSDPEPDCESDHSRQ